MKAGGGKAKGSAFEREVCRRLSLWVSNGHKEDLFWRSAMSGGRATVQRRKGVDVRQAGDITAVAPEGHVLTDKYYIECKAYRSLAFDRFIFLGQGTLMKFWRVAVKEARKYHRRPMIICKQNGFPIVMVCGFKWKLEPVASYYSPGGGVAHFYFFDDVLGEDFDG